MRSLCLVLVLSNILYLAWSHFIDVDFSGYAELQHGNERPAAIALASEIANMNASTVNEQPKLDKGTNATSECVSVGPFASLPEATRAAATLSAAGFNFKQRVEQGELWAGYWVYVPDLSAPGAAEGAIRQLQARGVDDVFLLPGEGSPVLSLGVFVDVDRARRRAEVARELGLKVRMTDRKRMGSVYWIDATSATPGQKLEPAMFPPEPGKIVRIELQPCPE
jgi:hypothetical protein